MIAIAWQEVRFATRRTAWPVAVVGHAAVAALFVIVWGPTNGVPLWQAPALAQLAAAERVSSAILLTWLATYVLTDDPDRSLADWSALSGLSAKAVFRARLWAIVLLTLVFVSVAGPAFGAAAEESAASVRDAIVQFSGALGFALFCVAAAAVAAVAFTNRVAAWSAGMTACLIAAVGVRFIQTNALRAAIPAAIAAALLLAVPGGVRTSRSNDGQ